MFKFWQNLSATYKIVIVSVLVIAIVGFYYVDSLKYVVNADKVGILENKTLTGSYSKSMGGYGTGYDYEVQIKKSGEKYEYTINRRHWDQYSGKNEFEKFNGMMSEKFVDYDSEVAGTKSKEIIWMCETGGMAGQFAFLTHNAELKSESGLIEARLFNSKGDSFACITLQ
jgi:hypothetical protein